MPKSSSSHPILDYIKRILTDKNHTECRCSICNETLFPLQTFRFQGQKVCRNCYMKLGIGEFCYTCGAEGPLYRWNGQLYCSDCYPPSKLNQCRLCGDYMDEIELQYRDINGCPVRFCKSCASIIDQEGIDSFHELLSHPLYQSAYNDKKMPIKKTSLKAEKERILDNIKTMEYIYNQINLCISRRRYKNVSFSPEQICAIQAALQEYETIEVQKDLIAARQAVENAKSIVDIEITKNNLIPIGKHLDRLYTLIKG